MDNIGNRLTVRICNSTPIELIDFTESLLSIGQQYGRFIAKNPEFAEAKDVRLFIKEVRSGSIIADLVALSPFAIPLINNANSVFEFAGYFSSFGKFLLGKGDEKPKSIERPDYEQFSKILNPVAKDRAAQMNVSAIINGNVSVNNTFNINHVEANAMQNSINRQLQLLKEPVERLHKKVLLYWYQARNDHKSKAGDRAIIESICQYPIKTIFAIDSLKHEMLFESKGNPFHYAYLVDVYVETIQGRIAAYKLIEMHEKFEKPSQDDECSLFT